MNDLVSNFADQVRQYVLDVIEGKKNTDDKRLSYYAKAVRKYKELINKPPDEISEEELEMIENYLAEATQNSNCGFGEIIDNAISQLKSCVEELKSSIEKIRS